MGTAVLRPHNLMVERFKFQATTSFQQHRRRNFQSKTKSYNSSSSSSLNNSSSSSSRSDKRRSISHRKNDGGAGLVNGQVTLLKRGESLDSIVSKINGGDSNRKPSFQIRVPPQANVYAGSAFFSSPSPRNLPLPTFSSPINKKQANDQLTATTTTTSRDDLASRDLRRLLRLN